MKLRQQHKEELRAQMQANEERQKRGHAEYLLEGERTRQKLQAEKDFIEVSRNLQAMALYCQLWLHLLKEWLRGDAVARARCI